MLQKIMITVSRYDAMLGLCGVSDAVATSALNIRTDFNDPEIETTQRLAAGCKVLSQIVHAAELQQDGNPITAIDASDIRIFYDAFFLNGGSEKGAAARNAAVKVLNRLRAEIEEQGDESEQKSDAGEGLPEGFVTVPTLR
jgi:hypothetical protein